MPIPRNRLGVATFLAFVMFFVTACGSLFGDDKPAQNADPTPGKTQSSEAIATPEATTTPLASATQQPAESATPTALPQFGQLKAVSVYDASKASPTSPTLNGSANVPVYLQAVMQSSRNVWRATLSADGLDMPGVTYDVTSRSDRYVSRCTRDGKAIVVTASYGRLFYCQADNQPFGAIALPADVIAGIWKKANRKTADLAGAIVATRTSALVVTASLQQQLQLPTPEPTSRQYMATCLSGVWAHGVYAQNAFTEKELAVALEYAYTISSEVNGTVVPVDPTDLLITAWVVGFRSGSVGGCGTSYWR
ncbi:MAG TPA: hypothetical protein VJM46_03155 [Candidatus Saccharimonadales bacterium]|nr:hypothetical protein [Candidatus Saccharimonadales bacterium]